METVGLPAATRPLAIPIRFLEMTKNEPVSFTLPVEQDLPEVMSYDGQ